MTLSRCISESKLRKGGMTAAKMAERKKESVVSIRRGKLANRKKKESVSIRRGKIANRKVNHHHQKEKKISDQICKVAEPSNNTTERMDIVDQDMGINFQEEFILEVLIRLPVQSLLQSKCVSKFWEMLISDLYFKKKHLIYARNNLSSQKLLVCRQQGGDLNFSSSFLSPFQLAEENVRTLECPSKCESSRRYKIYSSCDGLVLLGVASKYDRQLFLWNPSTRELALLPRSKFTLEDFTFGLGYDTTSDSYKILKLYRGNRHQHRRRLSSAKMLTLKGGSWKRICNYPSCIRHGGHQFEFYPASDASNNITDLFYLHGAFHWIGISHGYSVASFSTSTEVFGDVPLLEIMYTIPTRGAVNYFSISVLGGMLCFSATFRSKGMGICKLWVMKDYGVKESWTNLFTVQDTNLYSVNPQYRFADGEVLLLCKYCWPLRAVLRTSKVPFGQWPQCVGFFGIVYTESLIPPKLLI